jgi:hypothetical protein
MASEITPWKKPGCSLSLIEMDLSTRETSSREINEKYGEGGGLNANYRTVEAVAKASNILGHYGLKYGEDFIFKTASGEEIFLDFCDETTVERAGSIFKKSKRFNLV